MIQWQLDHHIAPNAGAYVNTNVNKKDLKHIVSSLVDDDVG